MKKILFVVTVVVSLFVIVGCNKKSIEVNVPVSDIMKDIKAVIVEDMKNEGVPEESFKDGQVPMHMEIDLSSDTITPLSEVINKEELEEGIAIQPMINIKSNMIIVLKAKDVSEVENLKASLEAVKEQQIQIWEQYLPDQYEKVKNNIIKTNGKYLIYITYDTPEKIESIFNDTLK